MMIRPDVDRVEVLIGVLRNVASQGVLGAALAGKLYGKMMFLSSQYFGRCGRALLRAFSRRQHELHRLGLNPQLVYAIHFWIERMQNLRPREIPLNLDKLPVFVSYSDGEGEGAGVGVALFPPDNICPVGGYMKLPDEIREVWSRAATSDDAYDIYEIEAVGPALVLHNWLHLLPEGSLWIHFIDNDAALSTLVKGSSSVLSGECITAYVHAMIADRGLWSWFDRVSSSDNPVDQLSRCKMEGPWELKGIEFPSVLLSSLRAYLSTTRV